MKTLITGGNAGLGYETAKELLKQGYEVVITARTEDKGKAAVESLMIEIPSAKISYEILELKSLKSVHTFGQKWRENKSSLNILINNAGIMNTPFEVTEDGFEAQFQVNHLSHFLLTHYLLPSLLSSASDFPSRIINLSSRAHMRYQQSIDFGDVKKPSPDTYDGWAAYGRSKLSNILFAKGLAVKYPFETSNIHVSSLHPGLVATKLLNVAPAMASSAIPVSEGIQGILQLALSDIDPSTSGSYFHDGHIASYENGEVSMIPSSRKEIDHLWSESLQFVGLTNESYGL